MQLQLLKHSTLSVISHLQQLTAWLHLPQSSQRAKLLLYQMKQLCHDSCPFRCAFTPSQQQRAQMQP
jgi:hypothetical protein